MNSTELVLGRQRTGFWSAITDPRVDRAVAIVACGPFVYLTYHRLFSQELDFPRIALAVQTILMIGTMVVRRPPVRVTTNVLYWVTAFVATYWSFMTLWATEPGAAIAPTALTYALAITGLVIMVTARLTLGRNIGFVPAQRELVMTGIYGIVRHPIYTALFVNLLGIALRSYSPRNLLIISIGASLFVIKTFMEEDFLKEDPTYARYMQRVRSRWIPFVA